MLKRLMDLFFFITILVITNGFAQENSFVRSGTSESYQNTPITPGPFYHEAILFQDDFNGDNTEAGLNSRGWITLNVDGGGTTSWFQGNPTVFNAFEGPTNGYVGQNFNGANGFYIDQWLISPLIGVTAGDTLSFYHRSPDGNTWDDSIYVKVSPTGGSNVGDFTISSPRLLVSETGWAQYNYIFTVTGFIRFAIQYQIFNGGPSGTYSNYVGIDYLQVKGQGYVPVELKSFVASVTGSNVTLNWSTATETNNQGFEIQRSNGGEYQVVGYVAGHGTTVEPQSYSFTDQNVGAGKYQYRLRQIDYDGKYEYSSVVEVEVLGPKEFSLAQNYPNPFNPTTAIDFNLAVDSKVTLKVFDVLGQEIITLVNGNLSAGSHKVSFDASSLNSGVYLYRIDATGADGKTFSAVKKMILNK
uniref:T9SS type A sorting domain-containing protein n=1 Tax=Ignavibacterium album TaxID=591197 RepID=A0A832DDW7_9BACT